MRLTQNTELVQWNLSFGTPLFKGHLHSGDTKFGPGKRICKLCICHLHWGDSSIQGKAGYLFWLPKSGFNLHSGNTLALKRRLTIKSVDKFKCAPVTMMTAFTTELFHSNRCSALVAIQQITSQR